MGFSCVCGLCPFAAPLVTATFRAFRAPNHAQRNSRPVHGAWGPRPVRVCVVGREIFPRVLLVPR